MDVSFKYTDGPLQEYPYLPVSGEILIQTKYSYAAIWTRDINQNLVPLVSGWDTVYQHFYHIEDLSDLDDVNIPSVTQYDILSYNNGDWAPASFPFTGLTTNFYDFDLVTYEVTNSAIIKKTTIDNKTPMVFKSDKLTANYNTRSSDGATSGSWSLTSVGSVWAFRLSKFDKNGVNITSTLRSIVSVSFPFFTLIVGQSRFNIYVSNVYDNLNAVSGFIELRLFASAKLVNSNFDFIQTVPYSTLEFSIYNRFVPTAIQELGRLPDGGNFDGNDSFPVVAHIPDGGFVVTRYGYLYSVNIGNNATPDNYGEFCSNSTNYLRLYFYTGEKEIFNISEYGGLNGVIPSPGMKITIYGNAYAGDYYLNSYDSNSKWLLQSGYYLIRTNQNLTTLFTGATGIQIHRTIGPNYKWVT